MTDTAPTPLDRAHAAMEADPASDTAAMRFYRLLADTPLHVLLDTEAQGGVVAPRVFALQAGPVILAFDSAERLAALGQGPVAYAELPGRVIAQQLAGQGVSLGLNFGSQAASETMLPPEALDWLAEMVDAPEPVLVQGRPVEFLAPHALPAVLHEALAFTFAAAPGLAQGAVLAAVRYEDGRRGHLLAVLDAHPDAEGPLAQAVAEAIGFSGLEAAEIDVTFLASDDPATARLMHVGVAFVIPPEPDAPGTASPAPPGSDPDRPPILRPAGRGNGSETMG